MKNTIISLMLAGLALALALSSSEAQPTPNPPGQISYQGFLTDANGLPLATNTPINYNVTFRIFNASTSGSLLWAEQQVVTVDRGYFTVMLGNGSAISPYGHDLTTVFSGNDASDRYLEMTVQGLAPGDPPIAPRLRLLASPYSFLARNALNVDGSALTTGTVADARLSSNVALRAGGNTFSGNQRFNAGDLFMDNTHAIWAKNSAGTDEVCFLPRHSDNVTYLYYGSGGFNIRNGTMFMANNGYVGIGTTAPTDTLQVNGVIQGIAFRPPGGHTFSFNWDGSHLHAIVDIIHDVGNVTLTASDRRLKEGIQPLANGALDRVMALQPSMFKYKDIPGSIFHGDGQVNEGFIADELQQVIPSAVNGDKDALTKDGQIQPQTLNIIPVVSVLTKAMQEQQQTIQQQQRAMQEVQWAIQGLNQKLAQRLEQKETEITELKARLQKLEALLEHISNGAAR